MLTALHQILSTGWHRLSPVSCSPLHHGAVQSSPPCLCCRWWMITSHNQKGKKDDDRRAWWENSVQIDSGFTVGVRRDLKSRASCFKSFTKVFPADCQHQKDGGVDPRRTEPHCEGTYERVDCGFSHTADTVVAVLSVCLISVLVWCSLVRQSWVEVMLEKSLPAHLSKLESGAPLH